MRARWQRIAACPAAVLAVYLVVQPAAAQTPERRPEPTRPQPGQPDQPADIDRMPQRDPSTAQPGQSGQMDFIRASQLREMSTLDQQGNRLGRVGNLAFDPPTGRIGYAALSVGEGRDRMHAVPWSALDVGGTSSNQVTVPFDRQAFERARGFGANDWPAEADPRFSVGTGGRTDLEREPGQIEREPARSGEGEPDRVRPEDSGIRGTGQQRIVQLDRLLNQPATTLDGTELGTIQDVVLDKRAGRIAYLAVGNDGKRHAVPWSAARSQSDGSVRLDLDRNKLAGAPAVDWDRFSDTSRRSWMNDVYSYYEATPYWEGQDRPVTTPDRERPERERRAK